MNLFSELGMNSATFITGTLVYSVAERAQWKHLLCKLDGTVLVQEKFLLKIVPIV